MGFMRCNLLLGTMLCFSLMGHAQSKTTLSAEVFGYQRDMVYFDCVQSPFIAAEFHTNPGEEHHYSFKTSQLQCMLINGQTNVLLMPGDSVHVIVKYDEKRVSSVAFSGTEKAVEANRLLRKIADLRRQMRYKSQLLACAVVDIKPKQRIDDSRVLLTKVQEMVKENNKKLQPTTAEYLLAETEAAAYTSFMEYPQMYADMRKTPISDQEIGDYWKLMDGVSLRKGPGAMRCPEYISFLMRYCFYENEKQAVKQGKKYEAPQTLETMFQTLASYYKGVQRDAVLYQLLVNFIRNGKELERVKPLLNAYKSKYNLDKTNIETLEKLLQ